MARLTTVVTTMGLVAFVLAPVTAAAGKPVHVRDGQHHEIRTVYYPDDICGPRSGWTTYDVTWHLVVNDQGDTYHASYVETGTYVTDLDDPTFEDYRSQFTEAVHVNVTRGGPAVTTSMFHDFPGSIRIKVQMVLVEVDGEVRVDRDVFEVSGCP